jgi:hypothetical protein
MDLVKEKLTWEELEKRYGKDTGFAKADYWLIGESYIEAEKAKKGWEIFSSCPIENLLFETSKPYGEWSAGKIVIDLSSRTEHQKLPRRSRRRWQL